MSKVNAMQAIREARYAARASNTTAIPAAGRAPTAVKADSAAVRSIPAAEPIPGAEPEALCGHRSMNNRICRRPAGHAEKNHRYN